MQMVRDGRKVWPTCSECGCRLFYHRLWGAEYLAHLLYDKNTDRRGHKCKEIDGWWPVTEEIKFFIGV